MVESWRSSRWACLNLERGGLADAATMVQAAAMAEDDDKAAPAPDLAHTFVQPANPLHGVTLEAMLRHLVTTYGWEELSRRIPAHCFANEPTMGSSLKFLRKTPWARGKVEGLYLFSLRDAKRGPGRPSRR